MQFPEVACYVQAMFIPSAEAHDTSYFMSRYIWNTEDDNVGGGSDFDDLTDTCSISCSSGSCYTPEEDVSTLFLLHFVNLSACDNC